MQSFPYKKKNWDYEFTCMLRCKFSKATFQSISMTSDAVLSEAKKTETIDVETQVGKQHWWGYHSENHVMYDSEKRK